VIPIQSNYLISKKALRDLATYYYLALAHYKTHWDSICRCELNKIEKEAPGQFKGAAIRLINFKKRFEENEKYGFKVFSNLITEDKTWVGDVIDDAVLLEISGPQRGKTWDFTEDEKEVRSCVFASPKLERVFYFRGKVNLNEGDLLKHAYLGDIKIYPNISRVQLSSSNIVRLLNNERESLNKLKFMFTNPLDADLICNTIRVVNNEVNFNHIIIDPELYHLFYYYIGHFKTKAVEQCIDDTRYYLITCECWKEKEHKLRIYWETFNSFFGKMPFELFNNKTFYIRVLCYQQLYDTIKYVHEIEKIDENEFLNASLYAHVRRRIKVPKKEIGVSQVTDSIVEREADFLFFPINTEIHNIDLFFEKEDQYETLPIWTQLELRKIVEYIDIHPEYADIYKKGFNSIQWDESKFKIPEDVIITFVYDLIRPPQEIQPMPTFFEDDYGYILDIRMGRIHVIGEQNFSLLECAGSDSLKIFDRVCIGKKEKNNKFIIRRLKYQDLSDRSKDYLPIIIRDLFKIPVNMERLLNRINNWRGLSIYIHQFDLLEIHPITKGRMIDQRNIKKFESYEDIENRIGIDIVELLADRLLLEIEGKTKEYILYPFGKKRV